MEMPKSKEPIGDEPSEKRMYLMPTCEACGGRGGTYDSEGNWIKCQTCGGSGQTNY